MMSDEKFLINLIELIDGDIEKAFSRLEYKTKRMGSIAYMRNGTVLINARPVFLHVDEDIKI